MTTIFRQGTACISLLILMGCQTTPKTDIKPVQKPPAPCWLQSPVSQNQVGFIGTAAPLSATQYGSIIASRQRALTSLITHYKLPLIELETNKVTHIASKITLNNGKEVYFSEPYSTADTLYSYASTTPIKTNEQCNEIQCNFVQCQPSWLCQGTQNSVIGVSYYTAFSHQKLPMSAQNAKTLAGYLAQARVNMNEQLSESFKIDDQADKQHAFKLSRQGDVTASKFENQLLMTNSCNYGSTLFANYQFSEKVTPAMRTINWRDKQLFEGKSVVLGNFGENGTIAPDNLLSSAIKYAIRDALVELAKVKGVEVSSNSTLVQNNGRYYLSHAHYSIKQTVSGRLLDIQINYKDGLPNVYVWLLEER
ncbi:hypothetical protein [Pseudoalteromonas luteoviolacea]|uniref:hypothetical protein n=1 Tax=Pseudoalteromonas luteoviolacea TaxID=43657 RepID=UPI001152EEEF|nr:hypothetical protein [Pseudoalteromonas luteoviolacea]TQF71575.1 hypothetical protein FLM44_11000 [Pseudoalteromonas luteoviolacea]